VTAGPLPGCILAGGQSRRMGGGDKGLRLLAGRPMLAHVAARVAPQAAPLALNANGEPGRFGALGLPVIPDRGIAAGPLAGLAAALAWARQAAPGASHLLTVPGDTPFLPTDLARRLAEAAASGRIGVASSAGRTHPVVALWPVSVAGDLEALLAADPAPSVRTFLARHSVIEADFPPIRVGARVVDPFFNVNTPADLAAAEAVLAET